MNRFLLIALLFISTSTFSQNFLNDQWQFKTGDSLVWKDVTYNSTKWTTIKSGIMWEDLGFAGYDGYAWYRKTVIVPVEFKKDVLKKGGMTLNLGTIDDVDQVFFNGKLIGETGKMPPNFQTAYEKNRKYDITTSDINWGKENLIAVRVFDNTGGGGLTGSDISLKIGELGSNIKIQAQFPTENHIFQNSQNVSFNFTVDNASPFAFNGKLQYYLINDFKDTITISNEDLKLAKKRSKIITYKSSKLAPGFYTMYVQLKSKFLNTAQVLKFGVEPEKIVSNTDRAVDFENFWMRAKRELAAVEPQFRLIHNDSLSTDKRDVYLVEMRSLDNVIIRGWYARPKATGRFPAILHVQGYSSSAEMSWGYKEDDMAVFVLNIRGHGNSRDEVNPGFPGYILHNLKDRERYIYRGAYMDCIRAVDFLCSREEIDSRYIVVEGGSQGGALSFATAALDNQRIKLCMPSVPFLSDFQDYFKIANWPGNEFVAFEKKNHDFGWKRIYENMSYFDIKNLAPWVKCPVFMTIGLQDIVCPPHINFAAYNQLNVPKSYFVFPEAGHGLPAENSVMKFDWMKKELTKLKK